MLLLGGVHLLLHVLELLEVDRHAGGVVGRLHFAGVGLVVVLVSAHTNCLTLASVPSTPIAPPPWLKVTSALAIAGIVAWPVLAMLGLLGTIPAETVVNVGIVTAVLAYVSIRRIKRDRALAAGEVNEPDPPERLP